MKKDMDNAILKDKSQTKLICKKSNLKLILIFLYLIHFYYFFLGVTDKNLPYSLVTHIWLTFYDIIYHVFLEKLSHLILR